MASRASLDDVVSHWCTLIEGLQASPLEFYKSVEAAIQRRQVPETARDRVDYKEAGLLSANREYLHVTREKLVIDLCGAPFGTGFFVSWWLVDEKARLNPILRLVALGVMTGFLLFMLNLFGLVGGLFATAIVVTLGLLTANVTAANGEFDDNLVVALPILGSLYSWLFRPATYYRIDSMLMFQKAIHNAVLEVIDDMTTAKGLRALADTDRRPVMREFYQRKVA